MPNAYNNVLPCVAESKIEALQNLCKFEICIIFVVGKHDLTFIRERDALCILVLNTNTKGTFVFIPCINFISRTRLKLFEKSYQE